MGFLRLGTGGSPKTFALWLFTVMGLATLGSIFGSWVGPAILTVVRDGWSELSHLPMKDAPFGNLPLWTLQESRKGIRLIVAFVYWMPIILAFAYFGRLGERLYVYLVVNKLRWLTQEQVDEARKREKQYF